MQSSNNHYNHRPPNVSVLSQGNTVMSIKGQFSSRNDEHKHLQPIRNTNNSTAANDNLNKMKICVDSNRRNINQALNTNSAKKDNCQQALNSTKMTSTATTVSTSLNGNKNPTQQQQERLKNKQLILIKPHENPNEGF